MGRGEKLVSYYLPGNRLALPPSHRERGTTADEVGEQGWGKSEEFESERPHGPTWQGDVPHLWVGGRLGLCIAFFSRPRVPVAGFKSLIMGGWMLSKVGEGDLTLEKHGLGDLLTVL